MDIQEKIKNLIRKALKDLEIEDTNFMVEHPENLGNGDYSSNVAMVLMRNMAQALDSHVNDITWTRSNIGNPKTPRELAEKLIEEINKNLPEEIEKIKVAGAGFINFYMSRKFFAGSIEEILNQRNTGENNLFAGQKIMVEYTDPNPFKPFHIGHLMTNTIGESIARILENSGAAVSRANYQGDVGLHVAKAIYGLLKNEELQDKTTSIAEQSANIGKAYAKGSEAYENDGEAKKEIEEINKKVYDRSDKEINEIYDWGFRVTMEAFEDLYKLLGTKFDFYFLESQMAPIGEKIVRGNLGEVFEESDRALVFKAEKHDPKLHTRVFITSAGLPTYETKELGLTEEKFKTLPGMNLSIVITANEQADYMKVVAKSLSLLHPDYENKMKHIVHGMMRFASGKMGSRKGNIITGEELLNQTKILVAEKIKERDFSGDEAETVIKQVALSAIKYSILKQSTGGDIIYDFEKSISFEGDSGPYLQYSYARANSVLEKAQKENILPDFKVTPEEVPEIEKLLYRFSEVARRSATEFEPHYIANYLIELARAYNSFYGNTIIVSKDDKNSPYKISLTYAFSFVMKKGLHFLGIEAPKKM